MADKGTNGTNGSDGAGVEAGGTTGQYLKKTSNDDYDTEWATPPGSIANIVEDTTPQLGGDLDAQGNHILPGVIDVHTRLGKKTSSRRGCQGPRLVPSLMKLSK